MKYDIEFSLEAKEDIERLKKSGDKRLLKKLFVIVTELKEHPKTGTGKPKILKHYKIDWMPAGIVGSFYN